MLTYFEVENYRNLGCMHLNLRDTKNYQFNTHLINGDILEKIVIMGGNGAGKTNFTLALVEIVNTLHDNVYEIGQTDDLYYLNSDTGSDRATFTYVFSFNGTQVRYKYSKSSPTRMLHEEVSIDKDTVILADHEAGKCKVDTRYPWSGTCDGSASVLKQIMSSPGMNPNDPICKLREYTRHILYYRSSGPVVDSHIGLVPGRTNLDEYYLDKGRVEGLKRFLAAVTDLDYDIVVEGGRLMMVRGGRSFPLTTSVSRGTHMLMRLFYWFNQNKRDGSMLIFDDFDCMFHYETAEKAFQTIVSNTSAQCVFITHHGRLFSNEISRPDCCFIMEGGSLDAVTYLTNKRLRKGHNMEKMVKDGEFNSRSE